MESLTVKTVFTKEQLDEALSFLAVRKDSCGSDGVYLSDLKEYWKINSDSILQALESEKYLPKTVRIIDIINVQGKRRSISIFSSVDRLLLRCIAVKMQEHYNEIFSPFCFAFRLGLGVEKAVKGVVEYLKEGKLWIAKIDIKDYFDSIPLPSLEERIQELVSEKALLKLLHQYFYCKIEDGGIITRKEQGIVQGSPLSPFMANLYLSALDHRLSQESISFCRYADDICLFFKSEKEACEGYRYISDILKHTFKLQINNDKSGVYYGLHQKYLGYRFRKEKKTGNIFSMRDRKQRMEVYYRWNADAIRRVDRNYHIINDGILSKRDFTVLFENEQGKKYIPVEAVQTLNVFSSIIFSSDFFRFMSEKKLSVNIFDRYGELAGSFYAAHNGFGGKTMLKQAEIYLDPAKRLAIAKKLEIGALHNLRANLRYYHYHKQEKRLKESIDAFSEFITLINEATDISKMLLTEARARQIYYNAYKYILEDEDFQFTKRTRRPPKDPLNSMISFGNVYLYNRIATEINKTSLDIRIGFMHSTNTRSQSLNLDIAEIFKPLIVDRTIFTLINRKMIHKNEHFELTDQGGMYLNREGKKLFLTELENKIYQKQTKDNQSVSYDTHIKQEVSKIYRFVCYDEKYKPFKYY